MVQFEEVLDGVRLVLTCSSPAGIRALLEGMVEEEIISEAYSKSLNLHRLDEWTSPEFLHSTPPCKPGPTEVISQSVRMFGSLECGESDIKDHSQTRFESVLLVEELQSTESWTNMHPLYQCQVTNECNQELESGPKTNGHYLSDGPGSTSIMCEIPCSLDGDNEMAHFLRSAESMQKPARDSESAKEGNSQDEREWLELVEEAARRIAVPLWQHWDRGGKMFLPLVPATNTGCTTSRSIATDGGAQCPFVQIAEEAELAVACRSLGLYSDNFKEVKVPDTSFTKAPAELCFGLTADQLGLSKPPAGEVSPVKVCMATDTGTRLTDPLGTAAGWTAAVQYNTGAGCIDVANLLSPTPKTTFAVTQDDSFYANAHHSLTLDMTENLQFISVSSATLSNTDFVSDYLGSKGNEKRTDSHWGAKMQEEEQDPLLYTEYGDLPEDLSEFMNDKYLLEPEELFEDLWKYEDNSIYNEVLISELDTHQQGPSHKLTGNTSTRKKRQRAARSQPCKDDGTPSKLKRRRTAGQLKSTEAQAEPAVTQNIDMESDPSPAKTAGLIPTPPRIVHLSPPIQIIIPDTSRWLSPPVIGFPLPGTSTAPTYILVPASPPPCKRQVPPLSPVDGAVAPVHMSSSPQGSDTASKAVSRPPLSPTNEFSPCKETPQVPAVLDVPQAVKDYIQEAKAHVSRSCQDTEDGLSLASHYVNRQLSQKETLHSGKNTNKCLDKELVIMGDTDRHKSSISQSQIFDSSNGDKPKRYILLFGNAGMGKTTLIRKLCLDWSRDCIPHFDFVFLLDGKACTLLEPTFSLQTLLLNLSTFSPPCMDAESVYAQILAAPKRVLIIFDGFDELREYECLLQNQEKDLITSLQKDSKAQTFTVKQLYSAILQRVLLPGCTLLLSTRPKGNASQILRRADSFLEVCGFTPTDVETYLSQYFSDPVLTRSALDYLKNCSFLHLLCWNPGLCRLVCLVLEHSTSPEDLPRTLTGLCHRVLRLKLEKHCRSIHSQAEDQKQMSEQSVEETKKTTSNRSRAGVRTRSRKSTQRATMAKVQEKEENEVGAEEIRTVGTEVDRKEERELLVQLGSLAWEGVKKNSSIPPKGRTLSAKLRALGLRLGIFVSRPLGTKTVVSHGDKEEGIEGNFEMGDEKEEIKAETKSTDASDDHMLLWANPFLQSYLAGVHLSLSRSVSDRSFLQTLPFQSGPKGRRRPQREEHELTQRFAVGVLFHKRTELQGLHSYTDTVFRDMLVSKQALVIKHLESLSHGDLSPAQVLEVCHYVYEASCKHGEDDSGSWRLVTHLVTNLPEVLTFSGVPLNPPDVFTVQKVLERGETEGRSFCLDLENSGIHVSGLRALVGLNNINTYRACIADVITLWEQLEQRGEEGLLQGAVSKFKIHPLKATQVCHVNHLAKLVSIHTQRRLQDSSSQSHSILADGVPAVKELHTLEFELDPAKGPLGLPKLWELLPGLHNLQHLDLEKGNIGDEGAEQLADALPALSSLEILNLSQNCIGDHGVKKLASTLRDLPRLHCLSLYSNVISDEGAESLAAVLPHMSSLTELDVKYNKLTDVGAQVLGASLRNCRKMKSLRMWNQCIPCGVFERLQMQDSRILWH